MLHMALGYLVMTGIGIFGTNQPVGWAFPIINFVWWIGIGHAGTLISAILLLFKQQWRMSISRFAEAMTIFAVACAAIFPVFHTGRPWLAAYWLFPYPNAMGLWPQFKSPLIWDVFAVSTYATVSIVFWYVGMIPDLATLRDRATSKIKAVASTAWSSLGWRGSARHWHRYEVASLILAGLSTPLVLSVHTVVSFDFAVSVIPGWHATIFPPYFVAGAIYAGFAMVLTLAIPVRRFYGMESLITMRHIDNMAKVMLATGLIVGYGYTMEAFFAWYSASPHEKFMMWNRMFGQYAWSYWTLIAINVVMVQFLWFKKVRQNVGLLFVMSLLDRRRHVARAVRDRRHLAGQRLRALVVGALHADAVGLHALCGHVRSVPDRVPAVPALRADDFDVRSQDAAAAGQGQGGTLMAHTPETTTALHGVMAEYDTGQALVDAARKTMAQGFTRVEAYSPVPIEELNDHHSQDAHGAAEAGARRRPDRHGDRLRAAGTWASVIEYPMNIGGRPLASWTTFIVPSYELTILFAALTAAIGMIVLSGLPQPYHPVFNVERFSMASSDKFFLVIESTDPKFGDGRRVSA